MLCGDAVLGLSRPKRCCCLLPVVLLPAACCPAACCPAVLLPAVLLSCCLLAPVSCRPAHHIHGTRLMFSRVSRDCVGHSTADSRELTPPFTVQIVLGYIYSSYRIKNIHKPVSPAGGGSEVVTAAVRKEKMFVCVPLLFYHQIISK